MKIRVLLQKWNHSDHPRITTIQFGAQIRLPAPPALAFLPSVHTGPAMREQCPLLRTQPVITPGGTAPKPMLIIFAANQLLPQRCAPRTALRGGLAHTGNSSRDDR